jgi:oligopeptide transport system substrate-binding protein
MCAFPALAPVPAHAPAEAVGAGPFRLVLRRVRDRVRVERNPHYWDAGQVQLEAIDFLTVESQVTALNLFLAGEVAYAPNAPELAIPALRRQLADSFAPTPQFASTFLRLNTSKPPFDQLHTRRAFARAVDQQALSRALGQTRIATEYFVPVDTPGWEPPRLPAWLDRQEAIQIEAPLGGFEYLYNSSELNRSVAEVLQDQWRRTLGQSVRLSNQEWKSFLAAQRGLEYQISRSSWIGDYLDPIAFLEIFHSASGNSRTGWVDAIYDRLIEQARRESHPEARRIVLREAERRLLDQAVIVPLYHEVSMELVSPRLLGFHRNLRGYIDWGRLAWQAEGQD